MLRRGGGLPQILVGSIDRFGRREVVAAGRRRLGRLSQVGGGGGGLLLVLSVVG